MAEKIADYFGQLGFRVDDKGLKEFISKLDAVAKKMQGLAKVASGSSAIKRVADGMKEIGDKAKVAGDAVDKAADKMVRANKRAAQAQIKEQQKLDKALGKGNASNPLTDLQNRIKANTAKKASLQSKVAIATDMAELARYEAWFGKAENRDASLGIAGGRASRKSRLSGDKNIAAVLADVNSAKAAREKLATMQKTREDRDALRAQRRAETASREDERHYQNRVSRTYAPKTSKLALYQSDLARTQMAYNAAMAAGDGSAKRYGEAIKKLRREINSLNREQALGKFGMKGFGKFGGLGGFLTPMLGMAAAGGAAGLGYGTVALNDQLVQQQSVQAQFQGLYGSKAAGSAGYQQYMDYANLRGIRGMQNAQDYLSFMYAGSSKIGTEGTNKIFQSFTELAKVRGTTGERYQRALTALGQMLSKGKLQAEEVKGQFSVCCPA